LVVKTLLVGGLLLTSAIHVGIFRPRLAKEYKKYLTALETIQSKEAAEPEHPTSFMVQQVKVLEGRVSKQTSRLTTVLRWEPLLGVAVLICTGLMNVFAGTLLPATTTQPTGNAQQQAVPAAAAKPFSTTVKTSDNQFTVKLDISPNRLGTNVFTVHVLNSSGTTETNIGVSLYTTMLDMDMGTDSLNLQPDGKGNFRGNGDFSMGGNWQIRIQIRTPDNALHETRVKLFTPY
jgi:copper transport protein